MFEAAFRWLEKLGSALGEKMQEIRKPAGQSESDVPKYAGRDAAFDCSGHPDRELMKALKCGVCGWTYLSEMLVRKITQIWFNPVHNVIFANLNEHCPHCGELFSIFLDKIEVLKTKQAPRRAQEDQK